MRKRDAEEFDSRPELLADVEKSEKSGGGGCPGVEKGGPLSRSLIVLRSITTVLNE